MEFEMLDNSVQNHLGITVDQPGSPCETRGWRSPPSNRAQPSTVCIQCLGWLEEINTISKKHMGQPGTKLVPLSSTQKKKHKSKIWDMLPTNLFEDDFNNENFQINGGNYHLKLFNVFKNKDLNLYSGII